MELTASEAWDHILERVRHRIPEQPYRMWLEPTRPVALSNDHLAVVAPSDFAAEWIEDKYGHILAETAQGLFGRRMAIAVQAPGDSAETGPAMEFPLSAAAVAQDVAAVPATAPQRTAAAMSLVGAPLNDRYVFERFVVGGNNQLAAAACRAVAERPGKMYNPLFIYGGVGLGKTHLMHAVGNAIRARDGSKSIAYVSSERFMNDLIGSIQDGRMPEFRRRYREIDVLLIDDVHFLREKERTQEEFFHTFNSLHEAQRQIVLASDRPPKEIPGLEDRLVSRFAWGLVADIKPPDLETRVAILRKKAEDDDLVLADEVLDYVARNCRLSVRELEGAIIKLLAYSSLTRREITSDLAREALGGSLTADTRPPELSPAGIRARVAEVWGVTVEGLASKRRVRELMEPRQVAMYLIRDMLDVPLVEIGYLFGGRDHSTVIHSIHKVEQELDRNEALRTRVQELRSEFGG